MIKRLRDCGLGPHPQAQARLTAFLERALRVLFFILKL